ncbi:MAG: hypothetical protein ACREHC_04915 [Candidatus Levyibacteriota bacterium]
MAKLKLSKTWTTVTPLSKFLAMALFIILPFVGFYLGVQYGKKVTPSYPPVQYTPPPPVTISNKPSSSPHMCPALAKACPDGTYVKMTGPHCEFQPCR